MSDDGGPAFPVTESDRCYASYGMTLRDWFAGQALAGLIASESMSTEESAHLTAPADARRAYAMADAMLAARKEPKA
jgi:hypothetical protein